MILSGWGRFPSVDCRVLEAHEIVDVQETIQKNRPIGQVRPANDILDPVQERGARRFKQHLLLIGIKLTDRETATARQAYNNGVR